MDQDNLVAAIDQAVGEPVHRQDTGSTPDEPADVQVLIRVTKTARERWKAAAEELGLTLSDLVRDAVEDRIKGVLECEHPENARKAYPWAEFCLVCGARLRG